MFLISVLATAALALSGLADHLDTINPPPFHLTDSSISLGPNSSFDGCFTGILGSLFLATSLFSISKTQVPFHLWVNNPLFHLDW